MPSRRAVMTGALAAAIVPAAAGAQNPPAKDAGAGKAAPTILRLQTQTIEVNGKPASVFAIRQPDGTAGITTDIGKRFRVRVENKIGEPSLIHWHGLTPPWRQDGVPGISAPPISPGGSANYDFKLRFGGTFWMHSHQGLQEQLLMAAPLIIHDDRDRPDQQEIVVMLADFSFTPPQQIFDELKQPKKMASMAMGNAGAAMAAAPDLNDVKYDAFLANDRTLADPEIVRVEPGGKVLLRIINSSSMSAYHVDLGALQGELIAVDGFQIAPTAGRVFPIAVAQRLDIRTTVPARARRLSDTRRPRRRPQANRHRAGRRGCRDFAHFGHGGAGVAGPDARVGTPLARRKAVGSAQGRPRAHPRPDRRHGEICLVDQ